MKKFKNGKKNGMIISIALALFVAIAFWLVIKYIDFVDNGSIQSASFSDFYYSKVI